MPYTKTGEVNRHRLVQELEALGMESTGCRADLVNRLMQSGVYQINTDHPPPVKFQDTSTRYPNHSSILLGNGAQIHHQNDEKLVICNRPQTEPLVHGDFKSKVVHINMCLNLEETTELSADTTGKDGDIRRCEDGLYMYRSINVHPGWYPLVFGTMLLF